MAIAARAGRRPAVRAREVRRSVYRLLFVMAACALCAGLVGYALARNGVIALDGGIGELVPRSVHSRFLADLWAHSASYAVGFFGGIAVCGRTYQQTLKASNVFAV